MAKEEKIKLTEISVPKGWKYLPFGDIFDFIQSNALSREQLTFDEHEGEIFNIHYGDIHSTYKTDLLDLDKEQKVPRIKDIVVSKTLAFLKDGDLIIADASEDYEGVAANLELRNIKKKKVTGGLHTFVARDTSGLTVQGFRTYILKNTAITTNLKKLATGSKVYGVSKANLATLKVLLPPEKEQIKIANILSTWETNIETLEKLIIRKKRNKKALMQQLLTGKKRFKEFENQPWLTQELSEIAEIKGGKRLPKGESLVEENTGFPYIRVTDMFMGGVNPEKILFIPKNIEPIIKNYKITTEDLFITVAGTIGLVGFIPEQLNGANLTENANKITNLKCDKTFLMYVLLWNNTQQFISSITTNNAQPKLAIERIRTIPVPCPSIAEQTKIGSVLLSADDEIKSLISELNHYKKQKQGLMQLLLTGQKRIKF